MCVAGPSVTGNAGQGGESEEGTIADMPWARRRATATGDGRYTRRRVRPIRRRQGRPTRPDKDGRLKCMI